MSTHSSSTRCYPSACLQVQVSLEGQSSECRARKSPGVESCQEAAFGLRNHLWGLALATNSDAILRIQLTSAAIRCVTNPRVQGIPYTKHYTDSENHHRGHGKAARAAHKCSWPGLPSALILHATATSQATSSRTAVPL